METTKLINLAIANKNLLVTVPQQQQINEILGSGFPQTYTVNSKEFVMVHIDSTLLQVFGEVNPEFIESNKIEISSCQFCQLRKLCESQKPKTLANFCESKWGVLENYNNHQFSELYAPIFVDIATII